MRGNGKSLTPAEMHRKESPLKIHALTQHRSPEEVQPSRLMPALTDDPHCTRRPINQSPRLASDDAALEGRRARKRGKERREGCGEEEEGASRTCGAALLSAERGGQAGLFLRRGSQRGAHVHLQRLELQQRALEAEAEHAASGAGGEGGVGGEGLTASGGELQGGAALR